MKFFLPPPRAKKWSASVCARFFFSNEKEKHYAKHHNCNSKRSHPFISEILVEIEKYFNQSYLSSEARTYKYKFINTAHCYCCCFSCSWLWSSKFSIFFSSTVILLWLAIAIAILNRIITEFQGFYAFLHHQSFGAGVVYFNATARSASIFIDQVKSGGEIWNNIKTKHYMNLMKYGVKILF